MYFTVTGGEQTRPRGRFWIFGYLLECHKDRKNRLLLGGLLHESPLYFADLRLQAEQNGIPGVTALMKSGV